MMTEQHYFQQFSGEPMAQIVGGVIDDHPFYVIGGGGKTEITLSPEAAGRCIPTPCLMDETERRTEVLIARMDCPPWQRYVQLTESDKKADGI